MLNLHPQPFQNALHVSANLAVPKANRADALAHQEIRSRLVMQAVIGQIVLAAVDFYVQFEFRAIEVEDVGPEALLAPEFGVGDFAVAEVFPEGFLGGGGLAPQDAGKGFVGGAYGDPSPYPLPRGERGGAFA